MARIKAAPAVWEVGQQVQGYWPDGDHGAGYYPGKIVAIWPNDKADIQWDDGSGINRVPFTDLKRRRGRPASSNTPSHDDTKGASVIKMPFGHKQEAFRRLAQQRTEKALKYIRLIQNLSDRRNYHYSPIEIAKILTTLREALDSVEKKFSDGVQSTTFQL
jgi:hypothetical protein